ncbi:cytochrome P450 [Litoreibacter ponti]|uniref:Cytochrome P450 n=1 Tax=Litoreibacter ponti TaxID=1510457 RepID=A0A2T6BMI1_9RHOB|nr:cytochrome P450 [Litoreibacter ponti]PTX57269.1 cytochrome P450 [Litoreibacter ponti]
MRNALPPRATLPRQPLGLIDSFKAARRNLLDIIPEAALHQPIVSGNQAARWHMITEPDAIRRVLRDRLDDYPKSDVTKSILRPAIGNSLFVAEGDDWRWQRRAAAPVFTHRNVANLSPIMSQAAERAAGRIAGAEGRAADMLAEMVTATFEVISDVTFSGDEGFDRAALHHAIDGYINGAAKVSFFDMLNLPDWVPRPSRVVASGTMNAMKSMADGVIEARSDGHRRDLLDLLLAGEDPDTKRKMTTPELRDNLLAFIVAGHETTALTLAWALYLCAFDQGVQDRARAEAQAVLGERVAAQSDIDALPYIRQIIDEALRLYPPAGILSRSARERDELCGTEILKGDTVMLPVYALHRSRQLWDNPDHFDPDRFAPGHKTARFTYLPFGDGPRICIGMSFAIQEAVIILATLLARFRFTLVPGKTPQPVLIVTTRPEGGVWLNVDAA